VKHGVAMLLIGLVDWFVGHVDVMWQNGWMDCVATWYRCFLHQYLLSETITDSRTSGRNFLKRIGSFHFLDQTFAES